MHWFHKSIINVWFRILLLILILALFSSGCGSGSADMSSTAVISSDPSNTLMEHTRTFPHQTSDPDRPLRLFSTVPDTLDPYKTKNSYVKMYIPLRYESLFAFDERQQPVSQLAGQYELSRDGVILKITLKENVHFHNGKLLVAEDVVYSYRQYAAGRKDLTHIRNVMALDARTVEFSLTNRDAFI
ncbi:MAG TPA: hypothetical protein DD727_03835, partial [Clostridiales bacterium]|nr:hypothetical protein [Clostridiales bacterium]